MNDRDTISRAKSVLIEADERNAWDIVQVLKGVFNDHNASDDEARKKREAERQRQLQYIADKRAELDRYEASIRDESRKGAARILAANTLAEAHAAGATEEVGDE